MFTLYSKNSWFIHVLVRNEKKNLCFTKIGKHDPNVKWFSIVSKYHFLYVESNIEQMYFWIYFR